MIYNDEVDINVVWQNIAQFDIAVTNNFKHLAPI